MEIVSDLLSTMQFAQQGYVYCPYLIEMKYDNVPFSRTRGSFRWRVEGKQFWYSTVALAIRLNNELKTNVTCKDPCQNCFQLWTPNMVSGMGASTLCLKFT